MLRDRACKGDHVASHASMHDGATGDGLMTGYAQSKRAHREPTSRTDTIQAIDATSRFLCVPQAFDAGRLELARAGGVVE